MMDQAVEGMTVKQPEVRETVSYLRAKEQHRLGIKDNLSYLRVKEQYQFEALQKQQAVAEATYDQEDASTSLGCMIRVNNSMGVPQLSLKEVIEVYAQEHDIQFFPKVDRTYDVLQVYGFGTICVYLDCAKQQAGAPRSFSYFNNFGVVLFEPISAKKVVDITRNNRDIGLANLVVSKIQCGVLEELVDPNLEIDVKPVVKDMVCRVAELAFRCLAAEKDDIPNMMEVAAQLQEIK
ncbi:hypothetical protein KI387_002104 [Taxus chinensis]|uniref:Serine-threonine/tyrosine-protein kinase catalytic domain-containing protein n=1 Tax=Taxus chinensis TaxID=29808 RepID=A0AA38GWY8_TAXCH|nr:hypothetical protein KI387_002104 [Taxus chinensis]